MARLHPNLHRQAYDTFGARAELRVLDILEQGLDGSYDIFHGVDWSTMYRGDQRFGEIDVVVCILTVQGFERKLSHQTIRRAIAN